MPRSTWSISTWMIFSSLPVSGGGLSSERELPIQVPPDRLHASLSHADADGGAGKTLVDVHRLELLAERAEADDVVVGEQPPGPRLQLLAFQLKGAQNALAADHQLRRTDLGSDLFEQVLHVLQDVGALGNRQHDALVDRAEEAEAFVLVHLLDRPRVVAPPDLYDDGVRGEHHRRQFTDCESDEASVLAAGGLGVDLGDDAGDRIRLGHDHFRLRADEMVDGEQLE